MQPIVVKYKARSRHHQDIQTPNTLDTDELHQKLLLPGSIVIAAIQVRITRAAAIDPPGAVATTRGDGGSEEGIVAVLSSLRLRV